MAAIAVAACSKKENDNIVNNQSNQETSLIKSGYISMGTAILCYWYDYRLNDPCQTIYVTDSLCRIEIGKGVEYFMAADLSIDPYDGTIKEIRIKNYNSLPTEYATWFINRISIGNITFKSDCPIYDDDVLETSSQDHIPAWTYDIYAQGSDAVIILL